MFVCVRVCVWYGVGVIVVVCGVCSMVWWWYWWCVCGTVMM